MFRQVIKYTDVIIWQRNKRSQDWLRVFYEDVDYDYGMMLDDFQIIQ